MCSEAQWGLINWLIIVSRKIIKSELTDLYKFLLDIQSHICKQIPQK